MLAALPSPLGELRAVRPATRWIARAQALWALLVIGAALALYTLSERFLPATLLAYGPRVVVLLPALLLAPLGLLAARGALLFTLLGTAVAVGPVMGFRTGASRGSIAPPAPDDRPTWVRVLTLNAMGGDRLVDRLPFLLELQLPQLVLLQECGPVLAQRLRSLPDWHVATDQGTCTASRWPLGEVDSMPRADLRELARLGYGGTGVALRYAVQHPVRPFHVVNLHLETARRGLNTLLGSDGLLPDSLALPERLPFTAGTERSRVNAIIRARESRRASEWARASLPANTGLLVAGDFNMPVESTIYRQYWREFVNAFEARGFGLGYTKIEGRLLRIRIDHVLLTPTTGSVMGAWVGGDVGSDHRPVVVDLELARGLGGDPPISPPS